MCQRGGEPLRLTIVSVRARLGSVDKLYRVMRIAITVAIV